MEKITLFILFLTVIFNSYGQGKMFPAQNNPLNAIPPRVINNAMFNPITYSISSLFSSNSAPTYSGMTNGIFTETKETGTNNGNEWIMMDLGSLRNVTSVVIGCDYNGVLEGGWGRGWTENRNVQYSSDNTNWTVAFNTGTFSQGIKTFSYSFSARYIRIVSSGWVCVTEFYAIGN